MNFQSVSDGILNLKEWLILSKYLEADELFGRLSTYWNITLTVSGLTAGFTFVGTFSTVSFTHNLGSVKASELTIIYGVFLVISFMLALGSSLLSTLLLGHLNLGGTSYARWFTQTFWYMFDIPITLLTVSLLSMLTASMMAIGGLYDSKVFVITVTFAIFKVFMVITTWMVLRHNVQLKIVEDGRQFLRDNDVNNKEVVKDAWNEKEKDKQMVELSAN